MNAELAATDPGSLSNLHDLVSLPSIPFWPPAPGWFVLGVLIICGLLWGLWQFIKTWRKNAYRREALSLLKALPAEPASLLQIDELLKRVALSVWPREQVASLSGQDWLQFLNQSAPEVKFLDRGGRILAEASYLPEPPPGDIASLIKLAEQWVCQHSRERPC
jgi:hypothetical protein